MKAYKFVTCCLILLLYTGCELKTSVSSQQEEGLIKVTILYPNGAGKTFDMDYYRESHMPMVEDLLGESMKFYRIDKGLASGRPDEPTPFSAVGYLYFDELSDYEESFGPVADKILSDIPNYTNIQPVVLISEVVK